MQREEKIIKMTAGFIFGTLRADYIHVTSIICFARINNAGEKPYTVTVMQRVDIFVLLQSTESVLYLTETLKTNVWFLTCFHLVQKVDQHNAQPQHMDFHMELLQVKGLKDPTVSLACVFCL